MRCVWVAFAFVQHRRVNAALVAVTLARFSCGNTTAVALTLGKRNWTWFTFTVRVYEGLSFTMPVYWQDADNDDEEDAVSSTGGLGIGWVAAFGGVFGWMTYLGILDPDLPCWQCTEPYFFYRESMELARVNAGVGVKMTLEPFFRVNAAVKKTQRQRNA